MNRRTALILSFLLLVVAVGGGILFWPYLYGYLIDPIARIFWLALRTFLMVDQEVYWILLIFTGVILTALMIPSRQDTYTQAHEGKPQSSVDRIAYWKTLLESAEDNPGARLALQHRLEELQTTVYSLVDGDEPGKINLPPEKSDHRPGSLAYFLQIQLLRLLRRRNPRFDSKLVQSIDPILASMEKALEIENDRSNEPFDS